MLEQFLPKAQFDLLFENSNDFVFYMEKDGGDFKYIYLNTPSTQLLSEDAIGKRVTELLDKCHYQSIIENYLLAVERKEQVNYQDYCHFVSEVKKYETSVFPIFHNNKTYILAITKEIAFDRDIEDKYLFMRSVFYNTFLSTVLVSNEGRLLEANPQFLEDFDLNLEEVRLKYLYDLPIISDQEYMKNLLKDVAKGNSPSSKLVTFTDREGKMRSFTATFTPIFQNNPENQFVALFVILQEITHFIQQEHELRTTSQGLTNFKFAINNAADISITDLNGTIIDVNNRFVEQTGFSREELIGSTHSILNPRLHSKEFFENLWSTIQKGIVWRGEICNRTKCGVHYWTDTTIIPLLDENQEIQQYMSIHYDITEKKRMLTELRNVEHMFKMITENTNDLIVITNEDGIILYASNAYTRKLGYQSDELLGQFYSEILTNESKQIWNEELSNIENSVNSKIELIHRSMRGEILWTECNYTVVNDYHRNRGIRIIMVAREITERKKMEDQLLFLAYHDALTMLPNRRFIQKEFPLLVEKATSNHQSIAILYVDGDNFKEVNDVFGHDVGDEFIKQFGTALSKSVRGNDFVVRIGGDEFAIVLTGLGRDGANRQKQVEQIVKRIKETLQKGWFIANHHFTPTSSIGISFFPDHGKELGKLLECADRALYDVKFTSKDSFKIYQE